MNSLAKTSVNAYRLPKSVTVFAIAEMLPMKTVKCAFNESMEKYFYLNTYTIRYWLV